MSKKQTLILSIIFILTFIVSAISGTFAWFSRLNISMESQKSNVSSAMTELITFNAGQPINILANSNNFGEGMDSLLGETFCSASLKVGSSKEFVRHSYFVKVNIEKNDFIYTLDENTPELLLIITDPDGQPITTLGDLKYVKTDKYEGFDITQVQGEYVITDNYEIATDDFAIHEWHLKIVFVNLKENQDKNKGRTLFGHMEIGSSEALS